MCVSLSPCDWVEKLQCSLGWPVLSLIEHLMSAWSQATSKAALSCIRVSATHLAGHVLETGHVGRGKRYEEQGQQAFRAVIVS